MNTLVPSMMSTDYPWHQTTIEFIARQLSDDYQPHAILFRWREAFDDCALGWEVAKHLICADTDEETHLKHNRLVDERVHPNVLFLDVIHDKIGVDNVRELEQQMWQTAMFDSPKVAYIQGIDLLSLGAQNALLKTLEEPPKNAFFVLSVKDFSRVLPTIMSRVQRLKHGKITNVAVKDWLQSQGDFNAAEIDTVTQLTDFAPLDALALLHAKESIADLTQEKARFADFVSGQCSASTLSDSLPKEQPELQLARYCRYTENLIRFLFEKSASNETQAGEPIPYATWRGVALPTLYHLHDALLQLQRLADTNVNLSLQVATRLKRWQQEAQWIIPMT